MQHYYESIKRDDLNPADGIDYKGSYYAHDTLEEAIEHADANGINYIYEIGGNWEEYEKCAFCGEWYSSTELNEYGDCERCVQAMRDHGGYRPRKKRAEVFHLGEWVECEIEVRYKDNTYRIAIPQYDYKGRYNGEWCKTVNADELRNIH